MFQSFLIICILVFYSASVFSQDGVDAKNKLPGIQSHKDSTVSSTRGYIKIFGEQRYWQGVYSFNKANEYYKDGLFDACIEELKVYSQLYPKHPSQLEALQLLSQAYVKNDDLQKAIEVDLKIFKDNSTTESGLSAYLEAARKSITIGNTKKGREILEYVKNQMFSSKLAKDADIELRQLDILENKQKITQNTVENPLTGSPEPAVNQEIKEKFPVNDFQDNEKKENGKTLDSIPLKN
ncbi:MAG: hypothetical protein H7A25_06775 [Leptospiraceae bacterium]|nr:hypothetical protein [Leptospiraceae bacterium]MCP5499590.1 hypothetical protein [Leptospiraceae bacterium]